MTSQLMTQTQHSADAAQWGLAPGEVLRLEIGPGPRELQVTEGRVWLTRQGTRERPADDLWLESGETVALASGSEWVLEGWGAARFRLMVPPRACPSTARRLKVSGGRRWSFWRVPALG